MASKAVEEALARAVGGVQHRTQCWAQFLPEGDAQEFLKALEDLEEDPTVHVNRTAVAESFSQFGVEMSDNMVGNHLRRKCRCRPKM